MLIGPAGAEKGVFTGPAYRNITHMAPPAARGNRLLGVLGSPLAVEVLR